MYFINPTNRYIEHVGAPFLWTLLFGPLYFIARGAWAHAALSVLLFAMSFGVSWLIYPFCAAQIMEKHYLRRGWERVPYGMERWT